MQSHLIVHSAQSALFVKTALPPRVAITWCCATRHGWIPWHRREGASCTRRGREFGYERDGTKGNLHLLEQEGPRGASGHQRGSCEGHEKVTKRKVPLGYEVREGDEKQEKGFNHCLLLRV